MTSTLIPFENKRSWFEIRNATATSADLFLYDEIGAYGITAGAFIQMLAGLKVATLNVHINSPGGSVFDGFAIYNALNAHPASIVVSVDGIAASIASVIAMAGDKIVMAENAMMMIHQPWTQLSGYAQDLRKQADILDKLQENIVNAYASRTGMKPADVLAAMEAETWYTAAECVAKGFATEVTPAKQIAAKLTLSDFAFKNAPLPAPAPVVEAPPAPAPAEAAEPTLSAIAEDKKTPLSIYLLRQSLLEKMQ